MIDQVAMLSNADLTLLQVFRRTSGLIGTRLGIAAEDVHIAPGLVCVSAILSRALPIS